MAFQWINLMWGLTLYGAKDDLRGHWTATTVGVARVIVQPNQTKPKVAFTTVHFTVSVGTGFGSKGKQHYKHTASETQSHTRDSTKLKEKKTWNISKVAQTRHKY